MRAARGGISLSLPSQGCLRLDSARAAPDGANAYMRGRSEPRPPHSSHPPTRPAMQWTDDALVLGLRRHWESSVILEAMTVNHGRHLGLVHGGRSRRMQPVLQPGNRVQSGSTSSTRR